ncbi:hypothetical protein V1511DRAFT_448897, partial [Dipodascopsis uninucleata]
RVPSYLGIPLSRRTPDDPLLNSSLKDSIRFERASIDAGPSKVYESDRSRHDHVLRISLTATGLCLVIGGTGVYLLDQIFEDTGGSNRQRHSYVLSQAVMATAVFTMGAKYASPSLRRLIVKYAYLDLPSLARTRGMSTRYVSSKASILFMPLNHRHLVHLVSAVCAYGFVAAEAEYLVNESALWGAMVSGILGSTLAATILPVALRALPSPVCGLTGIAASVLGFLSTFPEAGDVPHVLFLSTIALSTVGCLRRPCGLALNHTLIFGGTIGGWLYGKVPD